MGKRKVKYSRLLIVILPFILLTGVLGCFAIGGIKELLSSGSRTTYANAIESKEIYLRSNATTLQKELFNNLVNSYKKNDNGEKIAIATVENFVADFYTWTNKQGNYDVGGMYYIYDSKREDFYNYARDTFYKYVATYLDEYNGQILEVESILDTQGSLVRTLYEIDGKTYSTYLVTCKWSYKTQDQFKTSKYPTLSNFLVIYDDVKDKYEIVEIYE